MKRTKLAALPLLLPGDACAHGFGALYNLPVPLALYAWGSAAILVLSFAVAALILSSTGNPRHDRHRDISDSTVVHGLRRLLPALRAISVFLLCLCIATGLFGNPDPMRNFSPTFFWIVFLLGFAYLVAFIGDAYAAINPFRALSDWISRFFTHYGAGRTRLPKHWGVWPALCLYLAFIAFELFGSGKPRSVGAFLTGYSLLSLLGVGLVGARAWFAQCEFFSVFFRLLGQLAAIGYRRGHESEDHEPGESSLRLRRPFAGLVDDRPENLSVVVFALAMLSTTAFDGLRATQWWVQLFWQDPTGVLESIVGKRPIYAIGAVKPIYLAWESFWLFLSPFLYFAAYALAIWLAKVITGIKRPTGMLMLDFGYTLLPIALVYNITHYWTLLLNHGLKLFSFVSDPFGWRWDLFGTAYKFRAPILPDMGVVWHSQVGLILVGHIISAWVAHRVALRIWPSRRQAALSQIPLLLLMIGFSISGLWILAQPLTVMLMR